jgi:hypothetical protein
MRRAGYFFVLSVRPSQEARRMKTGSNTKSKISAQPAHAVAQQPQVIDQIPAVCPDR